MASATSSTVNKKINLDLEIGTLNDQTLVDLRKQVDALATSGTEAAPLFERFAVELDKIAQQRDAVATLGQMREQVDLTKASYDAAAQRAKEFSDQLKVQETVIETGRSTLDALVTTLRLQEEAEAALTEQLKRQRIEADATTKASVQYRQEQREGKLELLEYGKAITQLKDAISGTKTAIADQVKQSTALTAEYNRAETAASKFADSLGKQSTAMREVETSAEQLGVNTKDLAAASAELNIAFGSVGNEAVDAAENMKLFALQQATLAENQAKAKAELIGMNSAFIEYADQVKATQIAQLDLIKSENDVAESHRRLLAIYNDFNATQAQEAEAIRRNEASKREMAEADRLLAIQQQALNDLQRRGADALHAEEAAAREAAQAASLYAVEQRKIADAAVASEAALRKVNEAFAATGFRGAATINADIERINVALKELAGNASVTQKEFGQAFVGAQAKIAALRGELAGLPEATKTAGSGVEYLKGQLAQLTAIYSGFEIARKFIEANVEIQTLTRTLTNVTGSSSDAVKAIDLLRTTANRNGVAVQGLADDFIRFQASARAGGLSADVVNKTFVAVTDAAGAMGLSTERVGLILNGLGQIAGKGTVQMEELKGQIGDSLPGALKVASDALGITTADLGKLVESGQLTAKQFIPLFAAQLPKAFKGSGDEATGLLQSFNRLANAFRQVFQEANDSKALTALGSVMDSLAKNVHGVIDAVTFLGATFAGLKLASFANEFFGISTAMTAAQAAVGRTTIATAANTVETNLNTAAQARNAAVTAEGVAAKTAATAATTAMTEATIANTLASTGQLTSFGKVVTAVGSVGSGILGLGAKLLSSTNLLAAAGVAAYVYGDKLGELAGKLVTGIDLQKSDAAIKDMLTVKTQGVSSANDELLRKYTALGVALTKQQGDLTVATQAAEKHAQAVKDQGAATEKLAQLTGDEVKQRAAAVKATQDNVTAAEAVTAARQAETDVLAAQIKNMQDVAAASGGLTEEDKKAIETKNEKLNKLREEAEVSKAQVEQLRAELTVRQATRDMQGDQTKSLGTLIENYKLAQESVKALTEMEKQGVDVKGAMVKANEALAISEAKVRDAVKDSEKSLTDNINILKTKSTIAQADRQLDQERAKTSQLLAEAMGDEFKVNVARVDQIKAGIAQSQLQVTTQTQVIALTRQQIDEEERALKTLGKIPDEKQREIDARRANLDVMTKENSIASERIKQQEQEINNVNRQIGYYNALAGSIGPVSQAIAGLTEKYNAFTQAAIKANNAANLSVLGKTGSQGLNSDGSVFNQEGQINIPEGYTFDQQAYARDRAANPYATLNMQNYVRRDPAVATGAYTGSIGFSRNADGTISGSNKGGAANSGSAGVITTTNTQPSATPSGISNDTTKQIALSLNVGSTNATFMGSQAQADKLLAAIQLAQRTGGYTQ